jgi:hypothetical protein
MGKAGEEKSWPMSINYFGSPEKLKEHMQLQPIRIAGFLAVSNPASAD